MRERYVGTCPFQIVANQHVIQQDYTIISTSAFSKRAKYSRYIDGDKTYGQKRSCGGFDIVMYDKEYMIYGVEVKPEFSLNEFERALGAVIRHLTDQFWSSRVEQGMIVMPCNNHDDCKTMIKKKKLQNEID